MHRIFILTLLFCIAGCGSENDSSEITTSYDAAADYTSHSTKTVVAKKNWIGGADIALQAEFRCRRQQNCRPDAVELRITTGESDSHNCWMNIDGTRHEFGELHFVRDDSFFSTKDIATVPIPFPVFLRFAAAKRVEGHLGEFVFILDRVKLLPFANLATQAAGTPAP